MQCSARMVPFPQVAESDTLCDSMCMSIDCISIGMECIVLPGSSDVIEYLLPHQ